MGDSDAQIYYAEGGGSQDLVAVVLGALEAAGRSTDPIDSDDLAALDEFHGLGRAATLVLAEMAGISSGDRVLDVGAGIGGPARTLARHFGADVTALDASPRFCALNEELNRRTGLVDRILVVNADARNMPFKDATFDIAFSQAVWQSVEDKASVLSEVHRVLKPGGRMAIYEVLAGPGEGEIQFPVPWGDGPEHSFLVSGEEARDLAQEAGFEVVEWIQGMEAVDRIGEKAGSGAAEMSAGVEGVDLSLVMPDFQQRMEGLAANVSAQRIEIVIALLKRA